MKEKILLIGTGNMGNALIAGWIGSKKYNSENVWVFDTNKKASESVCEKWKVQVSENLIDTLQNVEIIVLAIKPVNLDTVLKTIQPELEARHLVVSIAAGASSHRIRKILGKQAQIGRVMPNTPGLIGEGISAIANDIISPDNLKKISGLFSCIGKVAYVPEKLMDAVTGLSGSGPAYVYLFIESLINGGIDAGLSADLARELAINTVIGAARMVQKTNESLSDLRKAVSSPGGTTIAGCKVLEDQGFTNTIISAVKAAANRSAELNSNS